MKPVFAKVLDGLGNEVYATRLIERPYFTTEFHFHIECQMNYVVKSSGHKIIGDCIENFETNELTLLGSYIPHVWYNDPLPGKRSYKAAVNARSVSLFFNPDKLTSLLSGFYNVKKLEQILQTAKRGMKFYGNTKEELKGLLLKMSVEDEGPVKMILLLEILQILCATREYELLAGAGYVNAYHARDNERMDKVFKYLFSNFSKDIRLDDVAAIAHMNKQAFCRYFKSRTQKTFIELVNEIRIAQACKLMANDNYSIGMIADKCGFNSPSNFNRFFKKAKGTTPRDYKLKLAR